jgi:hypothetical protein
MRGRVLYKKDESLKRLRFTKKDHIRLTSDCTECAQCFPWAREDEIPVGSIEGRGIAQDPLLADTERFRHAFSMEHLTEILNEQKTVNHDQPEHSRGFQFKAPPWPAPSMSWATSFWPSVLLPTIRLISMSTLKIGQGSSAVVESGVYEP